VSSTHGEQQAARRAYLRIARFFARLREKAEQLDAVQRWYRILSEALRKYLHGPAIDPARTPAADLTRQLRLQIRAQIAAVPGVNCRI
jgi:hypothetical protein